MITLHTNYGDIQLQLDFENTPTTAKNFQTYAQEGFYNGTIFHRVINNFMIQGGGFDESMQKKNTKSPIKNEAKNAKPNKRGTIAMARTSDPHSASAQFFINVKDNNFLNFTAETTDGYGYCVFGEVINGMEVVDKIKAVATTNRSMHQDVPVDPVVIEKVTITDENA